LPQAAPFRPVPVTLLFVALTVVITWPQAQHVTTHVGHHFDSFFSMWRIAWIAHALATEPSQLFHANIFFPQSNALALSDPMLLEGVTAAPLLWAGGSPVLAYNLLVLGSFVLSGVSASALGYRLSRSHGAAVLGGMLFAFAPYRFEHYFHLEILWAFWMPLALLALHRCVEQGRLRDGILIGALVAAQVLSCLYYGLYLGAALVIAAAVLIRWRERRGWRTLAVLAMGAAVAAAIAALYVQPLLAIRDDVPARLPQETARYSATLASYLSSPGSNLLYGWTSELGGPERRLFPGLVAIVLGGVAFARRDRIQWTYAAVVAFGVVASMGSNTMLFDWLRQYLDPYGMVRVPARFAAVVLCALSALVSIGAAGVILRAQPHQRWLVAALLGLLMLIEYRANPALTEVPLTPTPAYRWLRDQPEGPVIEFPLPRITSLPGDDPIRQYHSTAHWRPLLNGYSGYYPISYLRMLVRMQVFPRGRWIDHALDRGAQYVLIHEGGMERGQLVMALERLEAHKGVKRVGRFPEEKGAVWIYVRTGANPLFGPARAR
jgi:hypothetical protein